MKTMKKMLFLAVAVAALAVMLVLGAVSAAAADTVPFSGAGTEAEPYLITSADELAALSSLVNGGNDFSGKYIKLSKSLSLSGREWEPIGTAQAPFAGTFLGGGNAVLGLSVDTSESLGGLFGCVTGRIEALSVSGSVSVSSERSIYAGVLCGKLMGAVEDCEVSGTVVASSSRSVYAGGICGYAYDGCAISDVSSDAAVSAVSLERDAYAGGICGCLGGIASDSASSADAVTATAENGNAYAGSVCGYLYYGKYVACYAVVQSLLSPIGGTQEVAASEHDNAADVGELLSGAACVDAMAAQIISSQKQALAGEEITVDVKLSLNPGVSGVKLSFAYDPSRLSLVSADYSLFDTVLTAQSISVNPYTMVYLSTTDISADEVLATLTFTVLDNAPAGYADIGLTVAECVDENGTDVSCAAIVLDGGITVVKKGDANGDGKVNTSDATLILKYLAGYDVTLEEKLADANGDGKINTSDVTWILKNIG